MSTDRALRIALDLQSCQTESSHRGIGRYSLEFARALLQESGTSCEYIVGLDQTYPSGADKTMSKLQGLIPEAQILRYHYPGPRYSHGDRRDALRLAAKHIIRDAYSARSPDVIHVSSLFEGYVEHAAGLDLLADMPGATSSVTVYDLIPAIFSEIYLSHEPLRNWYNQKLEALKRFDVLLCISQATKADTLRLLNIPEERLYVINAGIDPVHRKLLQTEQDGQVLRSRWGINQRFVLYTGNDDPRKNLSGAIKAFAQVPEEIRNGVQLVLNQVGDESHLRLEASRAGLSENDLVITGKISDKDLAGLMRECEVFFFPSLYEGFGLPVLEAMAAGTAVISGNNSSLPEIVGRGDALFDASSCAESAHMLTRVLNDKDFRRSLENDANDRAAKFTWQRVSASAREAWDDALDRRAIKIRSSITSKKKLKVAMVTPLPSEQTGIADYAAELLPLLSTRMEIDVYTTASLEMVEQSLKDKFAIYDWRKLEARAKYYDQIVFQVGNSPFHSHMVNLLDIVGGVVVLHDFFVSSMFAHMDQCEGYSGLFRLELERSHGRGALLNLSTQAGWLDTRKEFPASRRMIEKSDGLILHSRYARRLVESHYPGLPRPHIFEIPHLRAMPKHLDSETREAIRAELGIHPHEILIASFGFLADTKQNLEFLEALADPSITARGNLAVVFVGELDGGGYGNAITQAIESHPLRGRINITGFTVTSLYRKYLQAADIAVQLRTNSRGETSGAVLDCLAHSIATIVNDYASFVEIPEHAVAKIPASFTVSDLIAQMARLISDREARIALAESGKKYVSENNAPDVIALLYEASIRESIRTKEDRHGGNLIEGLVQALVDSDSDEIDLSAVEFSLNVPKADEAFRLFIDLSEIVKTDYKTGIHRVVRNLTRELMLSNVVGSRCVAVALDGNDRLVSAESYLTDTLGLPSSSFGQKSSAKAGDVLFLLDSAWQAPERFLSEIQSVRSRGATVGAMVYDLIPIQFPQYCIDFMPKVFENWLRFVVLNCDFLVCISRSVSDDLACWVNKSGAAHRPDLRISHIRLGCDVEGGRGETEPPSNEILRALGTDRDTVLMVGTIEPRKRHDVALDAFERMWSEGGSKRLVIIGKAGWNVDALVRRITEHSQYGKTLFWLPNASDADLVHAYRYAERVLQASDAEGFGLPLVEAARYGRSIVATDLAVFREVAGNEADYFQAGDSNSLAAILSRPPTCPAPRLPTVRWSESATQLLKLIQLGPWDHVLT